MRIIDWLRTNSGEFLGKSLVLAKISTDSHWHLHTSSDSGLDSAYRDNHVYEHKVSKNALNFQITAIPRVDLQRKAIIETDKGIKTRLFDFEETDQNAFHFLFSNKIYVNNDSIKHTVPEGTRCSANVVVHDVLAYIPASERIAEQMPLLLDVLLVPFDGDEATADFVSGFTAKDKEGNTPLHCLLNNDYFLKYPNLIARLKRLPVEAKEAIASVKDKNGQTIIHKLAEGHEDFAEDIFGTAILRKAFITSEQADDNGNLPLHIACQTIVNRFDKVGYICQSLNDDEKEPTVEIKAGATSEEAEGKTLPSPVDVAFKQNRTYRQNPFHIICKNGANENKDDLPAFRSMKAVLTNEQFIKKMMEQETLGNTPLHFAIKKGNTKMVAEIFKDLSPEEKRELAKISLNKKETTLHLVCKHGNARILDLIADALGSLELYQIQKEFPNLSKSLRVLPSFDSVTQAIFNDKMEKYSNLLKGIHYFIDKVVVRSKDNFNARLEDFIACVHQRKAGMPISINSQFEAKKRLKLYQGSANYHNLRKGFEHITVAEIEECKAYFTKYPLKDKAKNELVWRILNAQPEKKLEEGDTNGCGEGAAQPAPPNNSPALSVLTPPSAPVEGEPGELTIGENVLPASQSPSRMYPSVAPQYVSVAVPGSSSAVPVVYTSFPPPASGAANSSSSAVPSSSKKGGLLSKLFGRRKDDDQKGEVVLSTGAPAATLPRKDS